MNDAVAIEILYILPKRQDRWIYVINDGRRHLETTDGIRRLVFPLLEDQNIPRFMELVSTLERILIIPSSPDQVFLLENDPNAIRERERVEVKLQKMQPDKEYQKMIQKKQKGEGKVGSDDNSKRSQKLINGMLKFFD